MTAIAYQRVPAFTSTAGLGKLVADPVIADAGSRFLLDLGDARSYAQTATTEAVTAARTFTDLVTGAPIGVSVPDALVNRGYNAGGRYLGLGHSIAGTPAANANIITMPANTALPAQAHDWVFLLWMARLSGMPAGRSFDTIAQLSGAAATATTIDLGNADQAPRINFNGAGGGSGGQGPALANDAVVQIGVGFRAAGGAGTTTMYHNAVSVAQAAVTATPTDVSANALRLGGARGSYVLFRAYAEDLTVSGRSAADVLAIDLAYSKNRFAAS